MLVKYTLTLTTAYLLSITPVLAQELNSTKPIMASKTDLISVYKDAADNNSDIKAARSTFKAQKEVIPQARAGLLPKLDGGAEVLNGRANLDTPSEVFNRSGTVYHATLSQPLFRINRWYRLKAAKAITEQASYNLSNSEQLLILRSSETYFAVLRAQDNLAATKAEEEAFKRQLDQSSERFHVGLSDKTDVLEAQASYDTARANRIIAERLVKDTFQALTTLTNHVYPAIEGIKHSLPILPPTPNNASDWVQTASKQNLSLLASDYAVTAAEESVSESKAGHAPTVDAIATYQQSDNDNFGLVNNQLGGIHYSGTVTESTIGVQLSIPIYTGGLTSSQVRQSYHTLDSTQQSQESLRRKVVASTRDLHRAVNTDVETVRARKQSIVSNQSSVKATKIGFDVGTRNIVDVLDAQRQLYNSVRSYNNARYDYIIDTLRLKQIAGTLSPGDLEELGTYLKADYNPDKDFLPPDIDQSANNFIESTSR